jgi:biotin carboxyl carrier protein
VEIATLGEHEMSRYLVNIDGREYEVLIGPDGVIGVEGFTGAINVQAVNGSLYSVLIDSVSTQVIATRNGREYQVLLKHNQVDAQVETERDRLLKKYATSANAAHTRCQVHAPMPALVVKVEVNVGDEVKNGQSLVILEAMKMENEIRSHQAGRVKEVYVTYGKAVEKGELLVLLE